MFVWFALHGMASITQSNVMAHLALSPEVIAKTQEYLMQKMGLALAASPSQGE
jgi:hypothetical protein